MKHLDLAIIIFCLKQGTKQKTCF